MKKIFLVLLLTLVAFTAFAQGSNEAPVSDLQYVTDKGTLVVGITSFEPMDYQDESGNWIGFDADMANAFAAYLGVDAEFVEIDWDSKVLELNAQTIDCVWNGMTLTDEVMAAMGTSNAYCNNAQVVVMKKATADKYATIEEMKDLAFVAEAGSAGEKEVNALGYAMTPVQTQASALMEVAAGTADAAVIDLLMAGAMIGEGTNYSDMVTTVELNSEKYGVGFRKDSELVAKLNDFFKQSYQDGSMIDIATTYGIHLSILEQ